jgi:hypothetical protein
MTTSRCGRLRRCAHYWGTEAMPGSGACRCRTAEAEHLTIRCNETVFSAFSAVKAVHDGHDWLIGWAGSHRAMRARLAEVEDPP